MTRHLLFPSILIVAGVVALLVLATHRPPPPVNPGRPAPVVVVR